MPLIQLFQNQMPRKSRSKLAYANKLIVDLSSYVMNDQRVAKRDLSYAAKGPEKKG